MRAAELAREVGCGAEGAEAWALAHRIARAATVAERAAFYGSAVGVLVLVGRDGAAYEAARMAWRAALDLEGGA